MRRLVMAMMVAGVAQAAQAADLAEQMGERTWLRADAGALVDEIPAAYKDIDQVMADQADLVEVRHVLRQLVNYKGV